MRSSVAAILAIGVISLAGCKTVVPLAIVDLQTDKVVIQGGDDEDDTAVVAKAREGCSVHGRIPLYLSEGRHCSGTACFSSGYSAFCSPASCVMHHLFACIE